MVSELSGIILSRRSVRSHFSSRPVSRRILEEIVACGLAAPSSKAATPWRFHVVTDRSTIDQIADTMLAADDVDRFVPKDPETGEPRPGLTSTVRESAEVLQSVPAAIFVENLGRFSTSRQSVATSSVPDLQDIIFGYGLEMMGIGAAVENMWLSAHASGVEGVFMGDVLIAEQQIRNILGIDNDFAGVLALGYAEPEIRSSSSTLNDSRHVRWHEVRPPAEPTTTSEDAAVCLAYRQEDCRAALQIHRALVSANVPCSLDAIIRPNISEDGGALQDTFEGARLVLALIGAGFNAGMSPTAAQYRIDGELDPLRSILRTAFESAAGSIPCVLPVLLEGSPLPAREMLPEDIRRLADIKALRFRDEDPQSLEHIVDAVTRLVGS